MMPDPLQFPADQQILAKPIDLNSLFSTLAKWLPKQEAVNSIEKSQD